MKRILILFIFTAWSFAAFTDMNFFIYDDMDGADWSPDQWFGSTMSPSLESSLQFRGSGCMRLDFSFIQLYGGCNVKGNLADLDYSPYAGGYYVFYVRGVESNPDVEFMSVLWRENQVINIGKSCTWKHIYNGSLLKQTNWQQVVVPLTPAEWALNINDDPAVRALDANPDVQTDNVSLLEVNFISQIGGNTSGTIYMDEFYWMTSNNFKPVTGLYPAPLATARPDTQIKAFVGHSATNVRMAINGRFYNLDDPELSMDVDGNVVYTLSNGNSYPSGVLTVYVDAYRVLANEAIPMRAASWYFVLGEADTRSDDNIIKNISLPSFIDLAGANPVSMYTIKNADITMKLFSLDGSEIGTILEYTDYQGLIEEDLDLSAMGRGLSAGACFLVIEYSGGDGRTTQSKSYLLEVR